MCLTVNKKLHPGKKPLVAKQDMYTFKVCRNLSEDKKVCFSFYKRAQQPLGKLLKSNMDSVDRYNEIEKGLHSLQIKNNIDSNGLGTHTFDLYPIYTSSISILLCKIPKGSKYFIGRQKDIVSNKLVLIEPLVSNTNAYSLECRIKNCEYVSDAYKEALKIFKSYYPLPKYV